MQRHTGRTLRRRARRQLGWERIESIDTNAATLYEVCIHRDARRQHVGTPPPDLSVGLRRANLNT